MIQKMRVSFIIDFFPKLKLLLIKQLKVVRNLMPHDNIMENFQQNYESPLFLVMLQTCSHIVGVVVRVLSQDYDMG